jgi:hypothetical protein
MAAFGVSLYGRFWVSSQGQSEPGSMRTARASASISATSSGVRGPPRCRRRVAHSRQARMRRRRVWRSLVMPGLEARRGPAQPPHHIATAATPAPAWAFRLERCGARHATVQSLFPVEQFGVGLIGPEWPRSYRLCPRSHKLCLGIRAPDADLLVIARGILRRHTAV